MFHHAKVSVKYESVLLADKELHIYRVCTHTHLY